MTRTRRRLLAALLGPFLIAATLVALAAPAGAVPLTGFAITSDHQASVTGQTVTLFATLTASSSPTGTVDFFDGATLICDDRPLSGINPTSQATCVTAALTVGTHSITGVYSGGNFDAETSPTFTQTVGPAATGTNIVSSINPSVFSGPVTITATVAPVGAGGGTPTGTVSFQDATVDITGCTAQTLTAGVATCVLSSLTVASHSITARYAGTSSYLTSLSSSLSQVVGIATTEVALTSNHDPASAGQSVTLQASVSTTAPATATPTGDVAFFRIRDDMTRQWLGTETLASGVATLSTSTLPAGDNNLIVVYRGTAELSISSGQHDQTVGHSDTITTVITSRSPARAGRFIAFTATVDATALNAGTPTGKVAFFRTKSGEDRQWIANVTLVNGVARLRTDDIPVGMYALTAVYRGTPTFGMSFGTVGQTITP